MAWKNSGCQDNRWKPDAHFDKTGVFAATQVSFALLSLSGVCIVSNQGSCFYKYYTDVETSKRQRSKETFQKQQRLGIIGTEYN